ncbi:MAG: hypothetical protein KAG45_01080 [Methyloprofundus sp.]|nr:hypothetical protein [Methyloprofundus sp.]TXL19044.1 hypothetical protein BMR06_11945 [Methylococcaceae bacterium HT5]
MKRKNILLFLLILSFFLNGCTAVYKGTGNVMLGYAKDEGVPYMLASDDVALGCSMAEAFTPFLLSFSRVTSPPDQLAILFYLVAGSCTEFRAQEQELRYLRAIYAKNSIEAQDARIAQQRLLGLAARRQLTGYYALVSAMSEPGGECPVFASDNDEFYWMLGLLDGIQAIINDIASGGSAEVPMDIAAKVGRGAVCLDNEEWWGVPAAIQAAIWIAIPGNEPVDKVPRQVLQQSMKIGEEQGMHIAHVLAAQVYLGQGDTEEVKQIIRRYAKLSKPAAENQEYEVLNRVSSLQIQAISDSLWTEAMGKRTPLGKVGTFWDDSSKAVDTIDIDELL